MPLVISKEQVASETLSRVKAWLESERGMKVDHKEEGDALHFEDADGVCIPCLISSALEEIGAGRACSECDEDGCPGLTSCPRCGVEEHGASAATHVADHGRCRECHKNWQLEGRA